VKSWLVETSLDGWEVAREEDNNQLNSFSFTGTFSVAGPASSGWWTLSGTMSGLAAYALQRGRSSGSSARRFPIPPMLFSLSVCGGPWGLRLMPWSHMGPSPPLERVRLGEIHAELTVPSCRRRLRVLVGSCGVSVLMLQRQMLSPPGLRAGTNFTTICRLQQGGHDQRLCHSSSASLFPSAKIGICVAVRLIPSHGPAHDHIVEHRRASRHLKGSTDLFSRPFVPLALSDPP
jgi:hypothetical protein